jgi:hypothetical protein
MLSFAFSGDGVSKPTVALIRKGGISARRFILTAEGARLLTRSVPRRRPIKREEMRRRGGLPRPYLGDAVDVTERESSL